MSRKRERERERESQVAKEIFYQDTGIIAFGMNLSSSASLPHLVRTFCIFVHRLLFESTSSFAELPIIANHERVCRDYRKVSERFFDSTRFDVTKLSLRE